MEAPHFFLTLLEEDLEEVEEEGVREGAEMEPPPRGMLDIKRVNSAHTHM